MKHLKLSLALSALLITAGAVFIIFFRSQQTTIVTPLPKAAEIQAAKAAAPKQTTQQPVVSGEPASLSIPSLGLNIDVTPGVYNKQTRQWTLTLDKVQYAVMTPEPNNQGGNTFLYGHYRKGVLATLHNIQPGAKAIVTTKNGKVFTYTFVSDRIVAPEDSAGIFDYQGAPILTIQTCTGVFFQNRQLFVFDLESVV